MSNVLELFKYNLCSKFKKFDHDLIRTNKIEIMFIRYQRRFEFFSQFFYLLMIYDLVNLALAELQQTQPKVNSSSTLYLSISEISKYFS